MLCDLSSFGLLQVSGQEAEKLLQGQLTCDVTMLHQGNSCLGAHCNPQGRIISLFYLFRFRDAYYLFMPRSMVSTAMNALKKYAVFYKAELTDASDALISIGYVGSNLPPDIAATSAVITPPAGKNRHIIIGEAATIKTLWETLARDTEITNAYAWKHVNILNNIPTIYPETSEKFLPHELNLDKLEAIDFSKGCYTGQEIIARMHYRGKLKNHMYLTKITSNVAPLPGDDISSLQGQDIRATGFVVDACREDKTNYLALITTDEANAKNEHLFLDHDYKAVFTFMPDV